MSTIFETLTDPFDALLGTRRGGGRPERDPDGPLGVRARAWAWCISELFAALQLKPQSARGALETASRMVASPPLGCTERDVDDLVFNVAANEFAKHASAEALNACKLLFGADRAQWTLEDMERCEFGFDDWWNSFRDTLDAVELAPDADAGALEEFISRLTLTVKARIC